MGYRSFDPTGEDSTNVKDKKRREAYLYALDKARTGNNKLRETARKMGEMIKKRDQRDGREY